MVELLFQGSHVVRPAIQVPAVLDAYPNSLLSGFPPPLSLAVAAFNCPGETFSPMAGTNTYSFSAVDAVVRGSFERRRKNMLTGRHRRAMKMS